MGNDDHNEAFGASDGESPAEEEEEFLSADDLSKDNGHFTIINTNARSLCPKISSLIDCFEEVGASLGVVTETWMTDGQSMEDDVQNFVLGTGLGFLYRNRKQNNRGFSHGGVAIIFKSSACSFTKLEFPNPGDFEVLVAVGTIPGHTRRMIVIGCYIPPGLSLIHI